MTAAPLLETERLILRGWRNEDFDAYAEIVLDPEVTRFISKARDRSDAWRHMAAMAGHWALRGYGPWAVERKSDGKVIGRVGYWNSEGWPSVELIWTLERASWGNGYAVEGAHAAMNYGFKTLALEKVTSHIDPKNYRSQAVAKRLGQRAGAVVDLTVAGEQFQTIAWEISREAWADRRATA